MPPLFIVPSRSNKSQVLDLAKKANTKKSTTIPAKKGSNQTITRINEIKAMVEQNLGKYKDDYLIINEQEILHDYITECIGNEYISIDTETDGLNPLKNVLAGICPYTYGQKGAYIPLNHISYVTGVKAPNQLDMEFVMSEFKRLLSKKPYIDMFNAKFDIRFLRAGGLSDIYCTYDGYLASIILNENETSHGLKPLHQKYVLNGQGDAFTFDSLFNGIPFTKIPYNVGYLYAAHDPVITTELCDYQRKYLKLDSEREDIRNMAWVFYNIEMPCVNVLADMQDTGIAFDVAYAKQLSEIYTKQLEEKTEKFYRTCDSFGNQLDQYRAKMGAANKLEYPINISSPVQIAIMLYDVLKLKSPDPSKPRGTGEEILQKIDHPIAKAILEYRTVNKLLTTYIDKLPDCVLDDGRIHCNFKQYGAVTGRMASEDPNLQNIPSHNKDIRKMFVASPGYVLMSSDYSQQEPKCLAALCKKQGDSQMYNTFMEGKDLYSEIASKAFNKPYDECREFDDAGNKNPPEYKERRTQAKSILLGVLYGRGVNSVAEQLKCSKEKAQQIKNSVFKGFPAIKKFEEDSLLMAEECGYVTTVCGRKRRLPDLQLPEYEFRWKDGIPPDDDLLNFDSMNHPEFDTSEVPERTQNKYLRKLHNCNWKDKPKIKQEALEEGIIIVDNGGKIADATRQCVNARIQGSAADLTKLAMIELNNNQELKKLGFRLLVPVHDEVICECPEENVKECSRLLAETMSHAAEEILKMPIKCDVEISREWYGKSLNKELGLEA